jgi:DNA polymerase (family 10)
MEDPVSCHPHRSAKINILEVDYPMSGNETSNKDIATLLDRIADLLDAKKENPFRVRSYRTAAQSIRDTKQSVAALVTSKGGEGIIGIKGVGERLAGLIQEYVEKGEVELVHTLEQEVPEEAKQSIPKQKAKHVFEKPIDIPLGLLLDVDEEYRTKAAAGKLKRIAPKKLNPEGKAWLPILLTEHEGYKFTVMFSNTARAHELEKTNDWVVVYYEKGKGENQVTIVTEQRGALKGKRVVRGREKECGEYY